MTHDKLQAGVGGWWNTARQCGTGVRRQQMGLMRLMGLMGLASNRVRSSTEADAAKTPDDSVKVDLTSRKIVQYTLLGLKGFYREAVGCGGRASTRPE